MLPNCLEPVVDWLCVRDVDAAQQGGESTAALDALASVIRSETESQCSVAVPGWETTWGTDPAPQWVPAGVEAGETPRIVVSRSRSRFDGSRLQAALGADIYTVGSAGVKAMAVVRAV